MNINKPSWMTTLESFSPKYFREAVEKIYTWWNAHDIGQFACSNISYGTAQRSVSTTSTILPIDHTVFADTTSASFTVTLPSAVGIMGKEFQFSNVGTKILTIATVSAQTINGGSTFFLPTQYTSVRLISNGSNWIAI